MQDIQPIVKQKYIIMTVNRYVLKKTYPSLFGFGVTKLWKNENHTFGPLYFIVGAWIVAFNNH